APFNQVQVDSHLRITAIGSRPGPRRLAFTGIHIIDPKLLSRIPAGIYSNIIDCYRELIQEGQGIRGYVSQGHYWRDIGSIKQYVLANQEAAGRRRFLVDAGCEVSPSARLRDWAVIGQGSVLVQGVEITRSVLWERVTVRPGVRIVDSVVTSEKEITGDVIRQVV
ncbi:MAG: hypothetical protein ACLFUT_13710, partial [Desulfobacteraceae bacterium]